MERAPVVATVEQRLFLALWPDAAVRAALDAARAPLNLRGGRLIPARNLHVTLVFLGTVGAGRRDCIERVLASVRGEAFAFDLTQFEWRRRSGIAWLSAAQAPPALTDLVASLNAGLAQCGHIADARPYRLHVTLARNVVQARTQPIAPIRWSVDSFSLVSSTPTPNGSEYAVERRWALG